MHGNPDKVPKSLIESHKKRENKFTVVFLVLNHFIIRTHLDDDKQMAPNELVYEQQQKNYNKKCTSQDGKFRENNICKNGSKHNKKLTNWPKQRASKFVVKLVILEIQLSSKTVRKFQ